MLTNKQFYLLLILILTLGVIYTGYSFLNYQMLKSSDEYLSQISSINNKIMKKRRELNQLKRKYSKNPNVTTLEYYMSLVKQFKYIVKGSQEIENFNISFLGRAKHKNKKRKKEKILTNGTNKILLSEYLRTYNKNKYLKSLDLIISFKLSKNNLMDLNENNLNFFKLYKPLIYFYYLKQNKPIIIQNIYYSKNNYNILIKIIGK